MESDPLETLSLISDLLAEIEGLRRALKMARDYIETNGTGSITDDGAVAEIDRALMRKKE